MTPHVACFFLSLLLSTAVLADELPFSDLKARGAMVLMDDELKQLLTGATIRYESSASNSNTQMKFSADGSVQGFSAPSIGASASNSRQFDGTSRVEKDRWCVTTRRDLRFCRDVIKLDGKYYTSLWNPKNEARLATEMTVGR